MPDIITSELAEWLNGNQNPAMLPAPRAELLPLKDRAVKPLQIFSPSPIAYPSEVMALQPTVKFDEMWRWIQIRWEMYRARVENRLALQSDLYMAEHKFTNVFREVDAESQNCIRIANDDISAISFREQFFWTILFKTFNLQTTWDYLTELNGFESPRLSTFDVAIYSDFLRRLQDGGLKIYSSAYLPGSNKEGVRRHVQAIQEMLDRGAPEHIAKLPTLQSIAHYLQDLKCGMARFKAAQFAMDLNYGPHLNVTDQHSFVMAGPGPVKCAPLLFTVRAKWTSTEVDAAIRLIHRYQDACSIAAIGVEVPRLEGREPAGMTVQNWLCEMQKFVLRTAKLYKGTGGQLPTPNLPIWWKAVPALKKERKRETLFLVATG